ncbi:MAG: ATP-binding cassette domain-containing protein [Ignavibacteria bacterium]|nr:MAG: ATP-binding cassette domain-containing protein [Ignavibacteria bacterium]
MLKVNNLVKEFQNITAVDNISFKVEPGKIFGLLGPNGAGKTTILRTVLNIIKPTSGKVLFNDKMITANFLNQIGYLPEERGLYRKSKVIDVILYFAELKNMSRTEAVKQADSWLKRLDILHYRNNKIDELSKGNQQKIQFIMSVIHNPQLLIFDEPFTGFDPINQQEIRELIFSFVSEGKIIILSTHQMETAEKLCTDIFLLNKGKEVTSGKLSHIKKEFGGNHVEIKFNGNVSFLSSMTEVITVDTYNNYAEVHLKDIVEPSVFLKKLTDKIDITHFSVIEPTLNRIFIDLIKQN